MAQQVIPKFYSRSRNKSYLFLAFFWLTGLAAGFRVYSHAPDVLSLLMRGIPSAPVSIVGSQILYLLPFLFSAFAVVYRAPMLLYWVAAVKAFLFAVVSIGLQDDVGSLGWLYRIVFLSGDSFTMPALYFFWLRSLSADRHIALGPRLILLGIFFLLGRVNNQLISQLFAGFGN